ncbi:MAG TPA: molybdopterin-synthase adenylyltransferase MoeB [Candidatus Polarisedimenticolaceae bacterium]
MTLSRDEILRYSRHLLLPEVTLEGQERLKRARVLCVGAGGLGSPLTLYLAAAGVGTIGIVEFDDVDLTNLQRQILYATSDVGRPKLEAATERLHGINPSIRIVPHALRLSADNVMDVIGGYDVVADGTDNFPTRYLVNDACVIAGKPNVYASIFRFDGQVSVFDASRGPCYRCLFPEPPPPGMVPSCAEGGVLGVLPGIVGSLQALEAIKLVLGKGDSLVGRLVLFDALGFVFREIAVRKDPNCPVCGERPTIREPRDEVASCETEPTPATLTVEAFHERREAGEPLFLLDVREPHEFAIARIPGSTLVPLRELPARLHELDSARTCVVTCHHGPRAFHAAEMLRRAGFTRVSVLVGGVDAWAKAIDPSMPRY